MAMEYSATVFAVSDLAAAVRYYVDVLGFTEEFRYENYAGVKSDLVTLHLNGHNVHQRPLGGGTVYIFCDEVDSYYEEIKKKGAILKSEPRVFPYGMKDFTVLDPDGNHLNFGSESKKT